MTRSVAAAGGEGREEMQVTFDGCSTPMRRALARLMSEISEDAYCAGWLMGLESVLWEILHHGRSRNFGQTIVSEQQVADLLYLSEMCGGWIVWEDTTEETFLPLQAWLERYEAGAAKRQRGERKPL